MRFFNTAGPVNPADHYCVPPLSRFNLDEMLLLIQQKKYFVLHAPRQVGKTSSKSGMANWKIPLPKAWPKLGTTWTV